MRDLLVFFENNNITYSFDSSCTPVDTLLFTNFCLDGRDATTKNVFLVTEKNHEFMQQAVDNGCIAIIIDKDTPIPSLTSSVTVIMIDDLANKIVLILTRFFSLTSFYPRIIAITGTNGKTSTAHLVAQLLTQANYRVGVLGTLGNGIFDQKGVSLRPSTLTTLDTMRLYQHLSEFNQQKVDFVVMEVSSHGISQNRIMGLVFDVVCFTNLSREHLDYHADMESYFACKARLFSDYVDENSHYVINLADQYGKRLLTSLLNNKKIPQKNIHTYEYQVDASVREVIPQHLILSADDTNNQHSLYYQHVHYPFSSTIFSTAIEYQNLVCAFAILLALDQPLHRIISYSKYIHPIAGRMQQVSQIDDDITVVVDYAHTGDALFNALSNLRKKIIAGASLICVFGCGGNRDKKKRQEMAEKASKLCHYLYITDDNPRDEKPELIRAQIIKGINTKQTTYEEIADRALAIREAIVSAQTNDIVLIAGKGHEKYQLKMGKKTPFDDVEEAQKSLSLRTQKSS